MKNSFLLCTSLLALASLTACNNNNHQECWTEYDDWGYPYTVCDDYYYASSDAINELDMAASVSESEEQKIQIAGLKFAQKYNLSTEDGVKIAKNVNDFTSLADRTNEDISDFAQKLYGLNPSEVVSAVSMAQVGNNSELTELVDKAAVNFNTDAQTMKTIIKDLHGQALRDNGIEL